MPYHDDKDPSFSTKRIGDRIIWKDWGFDKGYKNDVIGFVQAMSLYPNDESGRKLALKKIRAKNFSESKSGLVEYSEKTKGQLMYDHGFLRDEHLMYYDNLFVSEDTLNFFKIRALNRIGYKGKWFLKTDYFNLGFYWSFGDESERGYLPFIRNKKKKFWSQNIDSLEGLDQFDRDRKDVLITKAMKDLLCLFEQGYNPLTSSGESIYKIFAKHKHLFVGKDVTIWRDPDRQGFTFALNLISMLKPVANSIRVTKSSHGKDPSDVLAITRNVNLIHKIIKNGVRV